MTSTILPRFKLSNNLCCWQGGEGPSLLLIHGVGLNANAWAPMLPYLEPHFSITAIDLPGHGESPPIDAKGLSDYADKIAEILPRNCFVAGHSLGALLTMELAHLAADKITTIAPLNAIFRRTDEASNAVKARARQLSETNNANPSQTLVRWFGDAPTGMNKEMADHCRTMLNSVDPKAYKQAYTIFAEANGPSNAELKKIDCPALFVTGEDEPNSTPEMSQELAKAVANGYACSVPNARHMMPMTHAKIVAGHLIQFHQTKVLCHA